MTTLHDLVFCTERSIRYHDRRRGFYETTDDLSSWLSLVSGSGAVAALISTSLPDWLAIVFGGLVALIGLHTAVARPASMAALHAQLKQRFVDLRIKLAKAVEPEADELRALEVERLEIEREEPPIYRALDLVCHNELALAQGVKDPMHVYRLPFVMRVSAGVWRWDTNKVLSEAEYAAQQEGTR